MSQGMNVKFKGIILIFVCLLISACMDKSPPEPPKVIGVEQGRIYSAGVTIRAEEREGVTVTALIDNQPYEFGTLYEKNGIHKLVVSALKKNGLSAETKVSFEIDKIAPKQPDISGVEIGKIYNRPITIQVLEEAGVDYHAFIDKNTYSIGSAYKEKGEHIAEITAVKQRNGMKSTTTIPFELDFDRYTSFEMDYFFEISFGSEFGGKVDTLRKWTTNPRLTVSGNPTVEDMTALDDVVKDLNGLMSSIQLEMDQGKPNVFIYFIPQSQFPQYADAEVDTTNWGLFWYYSSEDGEIQEAKVLISTDQPNQEERSHLIREELTQALGLANDSWKYKDSIFYQGWTTVHEFSDLDEKIISLLYNGELGPGISEKTVKTFFESRKADVNERIRIFPVDEAKAVPDFWDFRKELSKAIREKNVNYLKEHLWENIVYTNLHDQGLGGFLAYWSMDTMSVSPLWVELEKVINLGGVFQDRSKEYFVGPYPQLFFPEYLELPQYGVVTDRKVRMYSKPSIDAQPMEDLNYDIIKWFLDYGQGVEIQKINQEEYRWVPVTTLWGDKGYVDNRSLYDPSGYSIGFKKIDGTWKIVFFIHEMLEMPQI